MDDNKISNKLIILHKVFSAIEERKKNKDNQSSYVSSLFNDGLKKIHAKIAEESAESIEASENGERDKIIYEYSDLLFHMMVGLSYHNISIEDICSELERRIGKKKQDYTLDE
jgi:phosphoribosyl-ATP pyrophosphohydrolase